MWPSFVALTFADALIIHHVPFSGDSASLVSGWLISVILNLIAIVLLTPLVARVVRRVRPDMPRLVARDYAGTVIAVAVTALLVGAGLSHRQSVEADRSALANAVARAQTYIGAHAPSQFRESPGSIDTYVLQARTIYRSCVSNITRTHYYCVVVSRVPASGMAVHYAGSEPNSLLAQGTG